MKTEINKFIDGLEEIFADIRERHVDDSVCGLCEYDGAYMGQSGDWCNECPGFDKDDCFKLSDETRKKWIEEIVNAYPDHIADIGKKASISDNHENDCISRQAAIDIVRDKCKRIPTCAILAMDAIAKLPVALPEPKSPQNGSFDFEQPEIKSDRTTDDCISREAAIDAVTNTLWHYPNEFYRNLNEYEFAKGLAELGLKSVPSAQPEPKWIPCTERFPEDGRYLVTRFDFVTNTCFLDILWYEKGVWWNRLYTGDFAVIAWMPLPEPYRGGEKE